MILPRRKFLGLAGAGALGVALGGCSSSPAPPKTAVRRFRSRPDLDPPEVRVTRRGADDAARYVLVTPAGPLVLDEAGDPVWVHPVPHAATTNLQVQRYEDRPVLTWWQGKITHYGIGNGQGVVVDAGYREVARIDAARGLRTDLHELVLTERNTAYVTAAGLIEADLRSVGGPRRGHLVESAVQEIDVASGDVLFEWRASEHLELGESYAAFDASQPYDPVHLNSIQELPDGSLLLSARNTWALYRVERPSGAIRWRLGGKRSDFHLTPDAVFAWQHDARLQPNGEISLFDDEGGPPRERAQSRALFLAVDETSRRVSVARQYVHGGNPLAANSQGSVQPLPGGDVFVGWGAKPYFSQYRPDGKMVLDGHILKGESYRAFRSAWHASPSEPPAIAVQRRNDGKMTVFASWNGSTETVRWRVRGGPEPSSMTPLAATGRSGFETEIGPMPRARYVVADALSATGRVLSTSSPLRAG